jgi:glyoxylase-like metal-dependent hydrolase (beta-lactamase superfamily II)
MIKKELSSDIIEYVFQPKKGQHFGNRITALLNKGKVMLIDTGYKHQAMEVINDLASNHLEIEGIIITHFHDDHMEGLKVMPSVPVYGSSYYKNTLDRWTPKEEHRYFTPTVCVETPLKVQFGNHEIEIIPFPGHSICTSIVKINDEYIHVADELMFSNKGEPILPCITKEDIRRQWESINKLKGYINYTFILGHGDNIKDKSQIEDLIENIRIYLEKILSTNNEISFNEATNKCTCTFLHKEWHENVYK